MLDRHLCKAWYVKQRLTIFHQEFPEVRRKEGKVY